MTRFYVTMTWDNWPEGGSFGTIVEAVDSEAAEALCHHEMAICRLEELPHCTACGQSIFEDQDENGFCEDCVDRRNNGETVENTEAGIKQVLADYSDKWHVVDCYDFDLQMHQRLPLHSVMTNWDDDTGLIQFTTDVKEKRIEIEFDDGTKVWIERQNDKTVIHGYATDHDSPVNLTLSKSSIEVDNQDFLEGHVA